MRMAWATHSASTATPVTIASASSTTRIMSMVLRTDCRAEVSTAAAVRVSLVMLTAVWAYMTLQGGGTGGRGDHDGWGTDTVRHCELAMWVTHAAGQCKAAAGGYLRPHEYLVCHGWSCSGTHLKWGSGAACCCEGEPGPLTEALQPLQHAHQIGMPTTKINRHARGTHGKALQHPLPSLQ